MGEARGGAGSGKAYDGSGGWSGGTKCWSGGDDGRGSEWASWSPRVARAVVGGGPASGEDTADGNGGTCGRGGAIGGERDWDGGS